MLATFMPKPFGHLTGNGGHFHMSLWDESGERDLFADDDDPNGLGLSQLGLPLHRRPEEARQGLHRGHRADRQQLQAADHDGRHADVRRDLVADLHHPRRQQPHPDAAAPRRPRRGPHGGRLVQPVPGGGGRSWPPAWTASSTASTPARTTTRTSTRSPPRSSRSAASSCCRPTCSTPPAIWPRTRCSARRSATPAPRTTSTTSSRRSRTEWAAYHEQVTPWEVKNYLTLF